MNAGKDMQGTVKAVSRDQAHNFSKSPRESIRLLEGLGVEGDAHLGVTVQHRSRVAADPTQLNLRQVHLIALELLEELQAKGFEVLPGQLGENITTHGLELLELPQGTLLHIGLEAVIEVTGLRNPCAQIDNFQKGMLSAVLEHDQHGNLVRKAGIMSIVLSAGEVKPEDEIRVELPPKPYLALERV